MQSLTISDCSLGTLYSKAVVPSESRKAILLGRPILESEGDRTRFYPQSLSTVFSFLFTCFLQLCFATSWCYSKTTFLNNRQIMTSYKVATLNTASFVWDKQERSWEVSIGSNPTPMQRCIITAPLRRLQLQKTQEGGGISAVTCGMFLPLVCDGEGQAVSGQREASSGNTAGAGKPWVCHSCQHPYKVCRRTEKSMLNSFVISLLMDVVWLWSLRVKTSYLSHVESLFSFFETFYLQ